MKHNATVHEDVHGLNENLHHKSPLLIFSTLFCFLTGTTGCSLSFLYFISRFRAKKSCSTLLFLLINTVDGTICILIIFVGVSEIRDRNPVLFSNPIFCDIWGILWYFCARLSIFLIGILSISRTYSIVNPLARLKLRTIIVPTLLYSGFVFVQQTFIFLLNARYKYEPDFVHCSIDPYDVFHDYHGLLFKLFFFIFVPFENIVPLLLIIASCLLTTYSLRRSKHSGALSRKGTAGVYSAVTSQVGCTKTGGAPMSPNVHYVHSSKRTATINILILTLVYLVFNTFSCTVLAMNCVEVFSDDKIRFLSTLPDRTRTFIQTITWVHLIALNSTCNVVVYFCRISSLRQYCVSLFIRRRALLQGNESVVNRRPTASRLLSSPSDLNFT